MATGGGVPRTAVTEAKCSLCKIGDMDISAETMCASGLHTFCPTCLDIIGKIWSSKNGCILCNMRPDSIASTASNSVKDDVDTTSGSGEGLSPGATTVARVLCSSHSGEEALSFCVTCNRAVCEKCLAEMCSAHDRIFFGDGALALSRGTDSHSTMLCMHEQARTRAGELEASMRGVEDATVQLRMQISKARIDVDEAYRFFCDLLRDRRAQVVDELEAIYNGRWQALNTELQDIRSHIDSFQEFTNIIETIALGGRDGTFSDAVFVPISGKLQSMLNRLQTYEPKPIDVAASVGDIRFVSNHQSMQVAVQNCLGYLYIDGSNENGSGTTLPSASSKHLSNSLTTPTVSLPVNSYETSASPMSLFDSSAAAPKFSLRRNNTASGDFTAQTNAIGNGTTRAGSSSQPGCWPNSLGLYFNSEVSGGTGSLSNSGVFSSIVGAEKHHSDLSAASDSWSMPSTNGSGIFSSHQSDSLLDGLSQGCNIGQNITLPSIKRQKMGYHCKFGEFGSRPGQFVEPSGIATNAMNDIIIADTNNHRLEVFDGSGLFKYEIVGGQTDCDLVYPNRLAVCRTTGDIVVTERSPTHQVQVFDRCGNFKRRFGSRVLQHPRGVAVDMHGRIVVVECRVMRVVIFDAAGTVINRFSLMGELEFPNGVAVDDNEHIYISDNRAHCVKVYSYSGAFVRTIGAAGITNYPIGVGVDRSGRVVVADNHNNFNVTVFGADGTLLRALESRVKHAHCYDMALAGDGDIIVSSKDFRIYIYRYDITPAPGAPECVDYQLL